MEESYKGYLNDQGNEKKWEDFWHLLDNFYIIIEDEYWDNLYVAYGKFKWNRFISQKNTFSKIWYKIANILYDTSIALVVCFLWILYFALGNLVVPIIPKNEVPESFLIKRGHSQGDRYIDILH